MLQQFSLQRLRPHLPNIAAVVIGKGAALVGLAVGTRLLTEVASTATFGTAKLVLGLSNLVFGLLLLPFTRFAMRKYHDVAREGAEAAFVRFARRTLLRGAVPLALVLSISFLVYRAVASEPGLATCVLAGLLLLGESVYALEYSLLVTRNLQIPANAIEALKLLGMPLAAAGAIVLAGDEPAVFLAAQVVLFATLMWAARRVLQRRATSGDAEQDPARVRRWGVEGWQYVAPMLPIGVFQWIVNVGDRYILGYFWSAQEVGQYSAVYGLIATPLVALGGIATTLAYPLWFRRAAEGNPAAERRIQNAMLLFQSAVAVVAFTAVLLTRGFVSTLLLGPDYREGAPTLMVWIAIGSCCLLTATPLDVKTYATKRIARMTIAYGAAAAVNVGLNLMLVPALGPIGAARATAATFAVYLLIMVFLSLRRT